MPRSTGSPARRTARRAGALALAVAVGLLAGCSDGEDATDSGTTSAAAPTSSAAAEATTEAAGPPSADAAQTLTATEGEMYIELSSADLGAGSYTIEVVNEGSATHDFVVEREGNDVAGTDTVAPGDTATLTVDLEPGDYVFYCSIGNHRSMGMEVTVTVT